MKILFWILSSILLTVKGDYSFFRGNRTVTNVPPPFPQPPFVDYPFDNTVPPEDGD